MAENKNEDRNKIDPVRSRSPQGDRSTRFARAASNGVEFLAVGDTATDVFIRLLDDSRAVVSGTPDTSSYRISLPFGDKIPYSQATVIAGVGNAPNAAVSAATLGLKSALVAHVGSDRSGKETIDALTKRGVDTTFMSAESGKETNYSYILWYKDERTILRRHEDFSYSLPDIGRPSWVYFSAVGGNAKKFYEDFSDYIENNPDTKFAFQPGGNEVSLGKKLSRFYKRADIFFCNVEEAKKILEDENLDIKNLLLEMHRLGPKIVVITDGPAGAYACDGNDTWFMPPYPDPKPPFERTGAGDAFSSTVVSALGLGKSLPEALAWGGVNSMSVVQEVGAQKGLLSREKLEEYLKNAPADYKARKI